MDSSAPTIARVEDRVSAAHRHSSTATALLFAAIGTCSAVVAARGSLPAGIAAVVLAVISSLVATRAMTKRQETSLVLPMSVILIWGVGYGISALVWFSPSLTTDSTARGLYPSSIPPALGVAAVSLLAWTLGYVVLRLRLLGIGLSRVARWSIRGGLSTTGLIYKRVMALYAMGMLGRLILLTAGRYAYITSDLEAAVTTGSGIGAAAGHLQSLVQISIVLLACMAFSNEANQRARRSLFVILAVEIPFGLLSGMRSSLILLFVAVLLVYILQTRKTPRLAIALALVSTSFLSPFVATYRTMVREDGRTSVSASEAALTIPSVASRTISEMTVSDIWNAPMDFATERLRLIDELAIVVQLTPSEVEYLSATSSITTATTVLVPRVIWSDKPVYTTGLDYARLYWDQPESIVSSRSPSFAGDGYRHGGLLASLAAMALIGGLCQCVSRCVNPRRSPLLIPLYLSCWLVITDFESSLTLLGASLAQAFLLTAVAMRWSTSAPESQLS